MTPSRPLPPPRPESRPCFETEILCLLLDMIDFNASYPVRIDELNGQPAAMVECQDELLHVYLDGESLVVAVQRLLSKVEEKSRDVFVRAVRRRQLRGRLIRGK